MIVGKSYMNEYKIVNSFCGFDPLKEVWLGDTYPVDFYHDLPPAIRSAWQKITDITKQDLHKFQVILESLGVTVRRPQFSANREDYVKADSVLVKPPITPRDTHLALGNNFYHLRMNDYKRDPWYLEIDRMRSAGVPIYFGPRHSDLGCLAPPSVVRVGRDIYVDIQTHEHVWNIISPTFVEWGRDYRVHLCDTGGHSDGVFCPVKEGVIIATHWLKNYEKTFPGWEVFVLPKETLPQSRNGSWWMSDSAINHNQSFADHIQQKALDWVGNYQETQFSVNLLVVNENTVIGTNDNQELRRFLKKHHIDLIVCDFQAKTFWDGGAHCITCDIGREGNKRDMFTERPDQSYLDWL
jgi:hypothetical protein